MKTNRELNTAYDKQAQERIRPKQGEYQLTALEQVVRLWIEESKNEPA